MPCDSASEGLAPDLVWPTMKETDKALVCFTAAVLTVGAAYIAFKVRSAKDERPLTPRTMVNKKVPQPTTAQASPHPELSPPISRVDTGLKRIGPSSLYPPPEAPGAKDTGVTQENIPVTICVPGYSQRIRPTRSVSQAIKTEMMADLRSPGDSADYQLDHVVPLELGGCPDCRKNLWLEPIADAVRKDKVERFLHGQVCSGRMSLQTAQNAIMQDWFAIYEGRFHKQPEPSRDSGAPWD